MQNVREELVTRRHQLLAWSQLILVTPEWVLRGVADYARLHKPSLTSEALSLAAWARSAVVSCE